MIRVDLKGVTHFIGAQLQKEAYQQAVRAFKHLRQASGVGAEWLGWRRILQEPNDAELERIDAEAERIRQEADIVIICGIGGSYLGAKAITDALTSPYTMGSGPELIFAGHDLNGGALNDLISYLDEPGPDGNSKSVMVNVISKSGSTLETALAFRVLRRWIHSRFPESASDRIICTTGPADGVLNTLADTHGYIRFVIPNDVGGRFSVLTPVGLLPAAIAGIDIRALFYEAVAQYQRLEEDPEPLLRYAAARYALGKEAKTIDLITSFETELTGMSRWLQQLLGESEGKEGKGIFPAVASYSTDLHSIGQFVQEGNKTLLETFITVEEDRVKFKVPPMPEEDGLDYLTGMTFHEINNNALEATRQAHQEGGVPCITISLAEKNAQNLGEFIYFFELFTAVYCYMLGVNPFDQPGVEVYKNGMYNRLGNK